MSEKTAIFLCDIQERFESNIIGFSRIVDIADRLLEVATILGLPVVVTEQNPKAFRSTVSQLSAKFDTVKDAVPLLVEEKYDFTMCSETIMRFCMDNNITTAVIVGLETHICIAQTAMQLMSHGIRPIVLADAVSSQRMFDRDCAIELLRHRGVDVTTFESWLFGHIKTSRHPQFKALSGAIRRAQVPAPFASE